MTKYAIFAGLGGGFGGAQYYGVYEFISKEEAERYAYDLAFDEYQSYEGCHGILSYEDVYEDLLASEWIEPGAQSDAEIDSIVEEHYIEEVEGWIEYKAIPVADAIDYADTTDADWSDHSDDADCFCD